MNQDRILDNDPNAATKFDEQLELSEIENVYDDALEGYGKPFNHEKDDRLENLAFASGAAVV